MTADALKERIEADIAEEARQCRMRAVFAARAEAKRPPPARKSPPVYCPFPRETGLETPDSDGDASDGFDYIHAAQGDYRAVCANQTGRILPEEVFTRLCDRRAEMDQQTEEIARALDSTGRFGASPYWRGENDPSRCFVIGVFSGTVLPLPPVKRASVLPSIAAQYRAKMLRDVEHFMACHPLNARMFTITNGKRVPIHRITLREDVTAFHRWLSKMASDPTFKVCGVRMQWRATEFGTPEWDPETGQMTLHLHAHCLVTEPEGMTRKRRAKVRRKLWRLFGVHWDDAGTIENAREFVKYPVKPADVQAIIRQGGPGVLADFIEAIRGLHTVQPMGDLRAVRSKRRAAARRITAFTREDGRSLEETGDWNALKRPFPKAKNRESLHLRKLWGVLQQVIPAPFRLFPGVKSEADAETETIARMDEGNRLETGVSGGKSPRVANRIIALLAPAPYGSPVCEPGATVWGFNGDLRAVLDQPRVRAVIEAHRAAWQAAQDARALVRASAGACAPGARVRASGKGSQWSNNCPADLGELALADAANGPPDADPGGFAARN